MSETFLTEAKSPSAARISIMSPTISYGRDVAIVSCEVGSDL